MRQAIETKYLGPTNHRGARVKASAQAGSIIVNWDHKLTVNENHDHARQALVDKLEWWYGENTTWVGGGNAKGNGNVYVEVKVQPNREL